jgi:D-beta-D-heptose 7-phosphate kinase/D-beta-D-heptose 1-phosphate adenosyltransferase
MGGHVVIGLNSDESVKKLKGQNRPINTELDRKYILKSIKYVDEVLIFNEETPYELIKTINPDIIVKGGDYEKKDVVGNDLCEVRIFNYKEGYSTTNLLSKF